MEPIKLNLSALEKTIKSLERSLELCDEFKGTKKLQEALRESVIQSFEVCYEVARRLMFRYLKQATDERVDEMAVHDVFRLGHRSGILSHVSSWFEYRKKRNLTSHIYNADIAEEVFCAAAPFLKDAKFLLKKLEEKIEA